MLGQKYDHEVDTQWHGYSRMCFLISIDADVSMDGTLDNK